MKHSTWEAHLGICRKVETGGRNADGNEDAPILDDQRRMIGILREHLPPPARILAPGAVSEALLLAEAGYEVHALVLGPDNVRWINERRARLSNPGLVVAKELDGHELFLGPEQVSGTHYPANHFDGYFSCQVHEHWLAPLVHIMETRLVMRDGGIVFVDACGTTNEACKMIWHTNLVPERTVREQWQYAGFAERWRGPHGDQRPQFVFEMLPWGHPDFKNSGYLQWVKRLREGERVAYDRNCYACR